MTTKTITVRLESFNAGLLVSFCQKIVDTLNNYFLNSLAMITLPTAKRVYCVLRSPHVNKDSREHFEIRIHKRTFEISYDSVIPVFDLLSEMDLAPGIFCGICLFDSNDPDSDPDPTDYDYEYPDDNWEEESMGSGKSLSSEELSDEELDALYEQQYQEDADLASQEYADWASKWNAENLDK